MNRVKEIDFIKFIAMIIIVSGHAGVSVIRGLAPVHVGLFFVCSGFLLNEKLGLRELICKNINKLYVPFVSFSVVFIILHNRLQTEGWQYSTVQHYYLVLKHSFFMDVTETLLGPMWFLTVLFLATLMWGVIKKVQKIIDPGESISPIGLDIILYIILLLIGVNCTKDNKILEASFANPQIINVSLTVPLLIELGCRYKSWYGGAKIHFKRYCCILLLKDCAENTPFLSGCSKQ